LVTGATGFIGSAIARLLVQRGDEVIGTVREGSVVGRLAGLDIQTVRADVLDRRSIRRAMRGVERVFHAAGVADLNATRARTFSLNVEGTRIVLEEALRAGVQRAVYTSSVAAIGPARPGESADETAAWEAGRYRIAYLDAKHEAETAALRLIARGLPLVIVNPAHVLGPGIGSHPPGSSTTLVRRFLRREIPAYVDGTLNVVGVQDVARGHLLAQDRGEVGERYILGNRNFTLDRLFADLGRLSGIEPPAIKLPVRAALALAAAGGRGPVALALAAAGGVTGQTVATPTEIRAASLNWAFVNRKAKRELGWRPSPHEDCLEETVAWYQAHDAGKLAARGTRQPLALRVAGGALRRAGL
jgi:dihydroflavonol-4-reductase